MKKAHPLIGKFFHTFREGTYEVQYQGYILAVGEDGVLTQLFEWVIGDPSCEKWFPMAAVTGWDLYKSADEMNERYARVFSRTPPVPAYKDVTTQ